MTVQQISTPSSRILVHSAGTDLQLHHVTALPARPLEGEGDISALYQDLARCLSERGLHVLQEKVYGEPGAGDLVAAARAEALADRGAAPDHLPATLVGSTPCRGGAVAGVQICAASGPGLGPDACSTLRLDGRAVGRQLEAAGARMAFLSDVTGLTDAGADAPADRVAQGARMFQRVARLVEGVGFTYQHVARTWIYVHHLLDWYDEFNRVRTAAYTDLGVYDPHNFVALPASTGIQAAHPDGADCFMDLLLVAGADPGAPPTRPMCSTHQCEAASYGSSFSRGKKVSLDGTDVLYVSGTASIDLEGQTTHVGDHAGQILETLAAVQNLLQGEQADLSDIVTSALFFKDVEGFEAWEELRRERRVPAFPGIEVYGDVCRHELLFELEPTAVLNRGRR